MAFLNETFNVNDLPQDTGSDFSPIPVGDYHVKVVQSDLTNTKAGTGQYIKLRLDVMGPSHQGRVLFTNINIRNPNPKAEEIGRQQLGSILRAIGLASLTDTDQLVGGELSVKVIIKQDEQYGAQNEIKGFKSVSGSVPPMSSPQQPAAQQSAAATPPWMKK